MESLTVINSDKIPCGFPQNFLWGVAISAKQSEGAQNRGLTVADLQDFNPENKQPVKGDLTKSEILDRLENPDKYIFPKKRGMGFYKSYKSDIKLLSKAGIKTFRMSISWARIFPDGIKGEASDEGLSFYKSVFKELKKYDIEPIVTLYHDDMPVDIALDYNGFLDSDVVDSFVQYSVLVMTEYKEYVKYWIPVNQINLTRVGLSSIGVIKDTVDELEKQKFQGVHNKFVACARIAKEGRLINSNFKFGCMLADFLVSPISCKPEDIVFATEKNQMTMYYYADVQLRGEYPGYVKHYLIKNDITIKTNKNELELIKDNTLDFLAISYYNSNVVSADENSMAIGDSIMNPFLKANPWGWTINHLGLYDSLNKCWDRYQKPLMIAENGFGAIEELVDGKIIEDDYRIDYLRDHIAAIKLSIEKGVDVFAYCAWSPIDMVSSGTSEMRKRYGLIYNDIDDMGHGSSNRYPKKSYYWYKTLIETNAEIL